MLSMMAASTMKLLSTTRSTAMNKVDNTQPFPAVLNIVPHGTLRARAIRQPYAVLELMDDSEHSR